MLRPWNCLISFSVNNAGCARITFFGFVEDPCYYYIILYGHRPVEGDYNRFCIALHFIGSGITYISYYDHIARFSRHPEASLHIGDGGTFVRFAPLHSQKRLTGVFRHYQ